MIAFLKEKFSRLSLVAALVSVLALPAIGHAAGTSTVEEEPSATAMAVDLVLLRPVLFATTVVGGAVLLVSAPFSLAGGNFKEAAGTLFLGPGEATFVRCLGCTKPGYKKVVRAEDL